jgi:hypothetical protein
MSKVSPIQQLRRVFASTKWQPDTEHEIHAHIYGLRGVLAISALLWVYFQTFIPTVVADPGFETPGPTYQKIIRIVFGTLLWDETLIQSFFFALSARSICIRFLKDPKPATFSGSIVRRIIRMVIGVGVASAITSGIFHAIGTDTVKVFKETLPNKSSQSIATPESALQVFNSVFNIFWVVRGYYHQAANRFWPTATMWGVSLIYQQSWTIYFLMVILPYTRVTWHAQGLAVFAAGSFWMCSWGWYDAAGLLLAQYVINPKLQGRLTEGMKIKENVHIPWFAPGALMFIAGAAMKYCWAVFPSLINKELLLHPFLDLSENTSRAQFAAADPYPRVDNFLIIFGLMLIIETVQPVKNVLSAKWLVELGKRSLSKLITSFTWCYIILIIHLQACSSLRASSSTPSASASSFTFATTGAPPPVRPTLPSSSSEHSPRLPLRPSTGTSLTCHHRNSPRRPTCG